MEAEPSIPSLPARNKTLTAVAKNCAKTDIKVFWFCPVLLELSAIVESLKIAVFQNASIGAPFPANRYVPKGSVRNNRRLFEIYSC